MTDHLNVSALLDSKTEKQLLKMGSAILADIARLRVELAMVERALKTAKRAAEV